MDEELQPQLDTNTSVEVETIASETKQETPLETLPRLEDLIKSEKEVKVQNKIEGVTKVESNVQVENRVFKKSSEEKQKYIKRRLKIVTSVYVSVVALLLAFVGVNIVTLAMLNKDIKSNTKTINTQTERVVELSKEPAITGQDITISLNEPRDYSEDKKELTFLDKITILFRNLFG